MQFKRYLETRGASLSKTDKYLPFYALPYISNPREHKAFKHIFTKKWLEDQRGKLTTYLGKVLTIKRAES